MNRSWTAVATGLVAAGMVLAVVTGGAVAAKPADHYPPFSNACDKAGGTVSATVFGDQLASLACAKPNPPGLDAGDVDKLTRACKPVGGIASSVARSGSGDTFVCVLMQLIPS